MVWDVHGDEDGEGEVVQRQIDDGGASAVHIPEGYPPRLNESYAASSHARTAASRQCTYLPPGICTC